MTRIVKVYFGWTVTAIGGDPSLYLPWRFELERNGEVYRYHGIPNKCQTSRQALRRGWWRAKWLHDGTYGDHYQ